MADEHRIAAAARPALVGIDKDLQPGPSENGGLTPRRETVAAHQIDSNALQVLIAECYDAGMGARAWEHFLARLGSALDCLSAALISQSTTRNERWVLWSSGPVPERACGCAGTACDGAADGPPSGGAVFECWFPSRSNWPQDGRTSPRCLSGLVLYQPDEAVVLQAWRDRAADPFDEADHRLFADLVPHVGRALDIERFRRLCVAEQNSVRSVLDRLAESVFIIDRDGRVLTSNRAADEMVGRGCVWLLAGDRLMPAAAKDRDAFRRCLADVFSRDDHQDDARTVRLVLVGDLSTPPVSVAVTRLDSSAGTDNRDPPLAAVISRDPERRAVALTQELSETYQLTPSEARLAGMIVDGFSLIDAAARLKISKNTARSHMKRIYFKTCTENHADLIRALGRSFLPLFHDEAGRVEAKTDGKLST